MEERLPYVVYTLEKSDLIQFYFQMYHQRGHSPSPSHGIEYLMPKTRGHSSGGGGTGSTTHYGPIPPYSGYPGYPYPSSHQNPYGTASAQPHPG